MGFLLKGCCCYISSRVTIYEMHKCMLHKMFNLQLNVHTGIDNDMKVTS